MTGLNKTLLLELEQEGAKTRKMLTAVPLKNPDWKPHAKSMTIQRLAGHIAELPGWVSTTVNTDLLDFSKMDYKPAFPVSTEDHSN